MSRAPPESIWRVVRRGSLQDMSQHRNVANGLVPLAETKVGVIFDPFAGSSACTAAPISPWETQHSAVADLRWYYSESDGELGAHSGWENAVQMANFGGEHMPAIELIGGEATAATPTDTRIWAAKRCARIRSGLKLVPRPKQALLESSFSLRRQSVQLCGVVGRENEPVVGYLIASGQLQLKALQSPTERERVKRWAAEALSEAIAAYEDARDSLGEPRERRQRDRGEPKRAGGTHGASKRKLVPVELERGSWRPPVPA